MAVARRKNNSVEVDEIGDVVESVVSSVKHIEWDFETAEQMFIKEQKLRHLSPRTIEWHKENLHTLRVFLERQGLSTAPKLITTKVLKENYVLHMLETLGLSPVTINGRIRTLRAFFAYLADEGHRTSLFEGIYPSKRPFTEKVLYVMERNGRQTIQVRQ